MADERDIAEQIEILRADIASLTTTVSQLVTDIAGIQASLMRLESSADWDAANEAARLSGEALHPAGRGIIAAVAGVEAEIERHPLTAVLIALWVGKAIGRFTRN